jgi:hypothetical protein
MNRRCRLIVLLIAWLCPAADLWSAAQTAGPDPNLPKRLGALAGVVEVKETRFDRQLFTAGCEITVEQPLDHQNPQGERFRQRVFLGHAGYDKPVVLGTEGYAARGTSGGELQRILGGNQVTVEHRFFGRSVPSPVRWEYLTVKQSADDLHAIVTLLKTVYPGEWVSTGVSKGGQTALFYKCYYPQDYDITDFKPYLKSLKNPSNLAICPDGVKIVYNPATMAFIYHFLQYEAQHVVYIYGEMDAWSATQM